MRRAVSAGLAIMLSATPFVAHAQSYVWVGGVASVPLSDTKDALKTGYMASVGVGKGLTTEGSNAVSLNIEGLYGSSDYKVGSGSATLYGAFLNVEYDINQKATLHPYAYVGGGVLSVKPEQGDSKSKGAYQGGAGLAYKLNAQWTLWGDVRYLGSGSGLEKTTLLPVTIGFSRSFGGSM